MTTSEDGPLAALVLENFWAGVLDRSRLDADDATVRAWAIGYQ